VTDLRALLMYTSVLTTTAGRAVLLCILRNLLTAYFRDYNQHNQRPAGLRHTDIGYEQFKLLLETLFPWALRSQRIGCIHNQKLEQYDLLEFIRNQIQTCSSEASEKNLTYDEIFVSHCHDACDVSVPVANSKWPIMGLRYYGI